MMQHLKQKRSKHCLQVRDPVRISQSNKVMLSVNYDKWGRVAIIMI